MDDQAYLYPFDDEEDLLKQQLAQAYALRQQHAPERTTGTGALFSGLGGALNQFTGAMQQRDAMAQQQDMLKRKQAAMAADPERVLKLSIAKDAMAPANATYTQLAKKFGLELPPGTTNAQAKEMLGMGEKAYLAEGQLGLERARLNQGKFVQGAQGVLDTRTGSLVPYASGGGKPLTAKQTEDEFKALTESVSTNRGRANLNIDRQKRLDAAQRLEALVLGPNGQIQNLTKQQVKEASLSLANLIASGHVTEGLINDLTPETNAANWQNFKQKLFNEPKGAEAQAFLQNMLDTAGRETGITRQQMRAAQLQGVPNYSHLSKVDKKRYESILKGAGLDPASIDENGMPLQAAPVTPRAMDPGDAAALEWAQRNPNDPRAAQILRMHGAQ